MARCSQLLIRTTTSGQISTVLNDTEEPGGTGGTRGAAPPISMVCTTSPPELRTSLVYFGIIGMVVSTP